MAPRKPIVKLTDEQLWAIVNAPPEMSHGQLAKLVGGEYFTVAKARRRPWVRPVSYARCAGCGQAVTVKLAKYKDPVYHPECRTKVINRRMREKRAAGEAAVSTPYVRAWRERNPLKSRIMRDREREAAKARRTPFDIDDAVQKIHEYDEQVVESSRQRAVRNSQPWSQHEDDFLLEHIDETAAWLAEEMARTVHAVRARKVHLRRKHGMEYHRATEYVIPLNEAAREIGITVRELREMLGGKRPVAGKMSRAEVDVFVREQEKRALKMNMDILINETVEAILDALVMNDQNRASAAVEDALQRACRWDTREDTIPRFAAMLKAALELRFPHVPMGFSLEIGGEKIDLDTLQA